MGIATQRKLAEERAEAYRMHVEWALRQSGRHGRPIAYTAAATKLNERNIESPMGGQWRGVQLRRMTLRLGIEHPVARADFKEAQAQIYEMWKKDPHVTTTQVRARLRLPHPLGRPRIWQILKSLRQRAAKDSAAHRRVNWHIDRWTATRVRVAAIWTRQPELTARQVLKRFGPENAPTLRFVRRVLSKCWRASTNLTPHQLRNGRQFYRPYGAVNWNRRRTSTYGSRRRGSVRSRRA
jgi:hypothetical protein